MTKFSGKTIEEAIQTGLQSLDARREDVEIAVVEEGRGGVFGLGSKLAEVDITLLDATSAAVDAVDEPAPVLTETVVEASTAEDAAPAEPAAPESHPVAADDTDEAGDTPITQICNDFLQGVLNRMELNAEVETTLNEPDELNQDSYYYINIEGEDLGILIGRRGETLEALQHLVRLVVNRHTHDWPRIEVDVEHYKQRRVQNLQRLAHTMADNAVNDGRLVVLEAMPARERRLVHIALRDRDDVYTESIGDGDNRKVTISPREK